MNFIKQIKIKKQVTANIQKAEKIINNFKEFLSPAHDIYWCTILEVEYVQQNISLVKNNYKTIINSISQLKQLFEENSNLSAECDKIREKSNNFFITALETMFQEISKSIKDLTSIKNYEYYTHFHPVVDVLNSVEELIISTLYFCTLDLTPHEKTT